MTTANAPSDMPGFECIVVGGGPTGLAAAAGIRRAGLTVALIDEPPAAADVQSLKTAALFPPSVALLRGLGAWPRIASEAEPMTGLRLADDTGGLLRAPEVLFKATEIGLEALAHNVPNAAISRGLNEIAVAEGVVMPGAGRAISVSCGATGCTVTCADGRVLTSSFVVGSDGRASPTRAAAGIPTETWAYDQSALIAVFAHSRPHHGISTELHGPAGPCTTVPLAGRRSSLVWVDRPHRVAELMRLDDRAFSLALRERLAGLLGDVVASGARRWFPMAGLMAERMAKGRVALVGEAGHALPPIGAQGLNLGLADAAVLADAISKWVQDGRRQPIETVLAGYARRRDDDIRRRAGAVDVLNRSLEGGNPVARLVRGAGLHVLAALPGARKLLMSRGLEPPDPVPELMSRIA